ncbi:MAG TPA: carboxypeptidase-like regulatory domain-containing protein, partial [Pedobacter sp.]
MKLTSLYNPVLMIRNVKFKFLMVMKLTSILLLIGTLHVTAASFSQTVTISRKNTTLETVFKDIKKQTGFLFFYNEKVNITKQNVSVELNNASLDQALKACLAGQDLLYDIVNKTIVIRKKTPVAAENEAVSDKIEINGKVVDKDQGGIPGVNITVKNKALRAQTNSKGEFKITVDAGDILVFTYIGFKPKEVTVRDSKFLTVALEAQVNQMDAVVVTGYQTIKKDNYTGNAIVISGADLKRNNPQNLLKAVQSFDPSFKLMDNNLAGSDPNKLPKINVRGATALPAMTEDVLDRNDLSSSYNLPAFILDGFEVSLQKVVDMDLNRIESVTLLKDGAATAVYGSRAANGVMVITTKAPVAGKLQLSYNYELTVNAPDLSGYHVLNAKDKIAYEQLAGLYTYGGISADMQQDQLDADLFVRLKNVASGINTYWLSQPLQNSFAHKHSLYAQGGDQSFRYGIDLRYQTQPGVMIGSGNKRYSGGVNFTYNPSPKLIIKNDVTITQVDQVNSPYGDFSTYVNANPYFPMTDSAGNYIQELASWRIDTKKPGDQYKSVSVFNPLYDANLHSFDKTNYTEIIDAFSADYKLSGSFRLKGLVSVNKTNQSADRFISPLNSTFYNTAADKLNNRGSYDYTNEDRLGIDGNVTLNYNKQIGEHFFNLVLGANILASKSDFKQVQAQGFSNDRFTNIGFARIY